MVKVAINAAKSPKFAALNRKLSSPRTIAVTDLRHRSELTWFCVCAGRCVVFNTGPYTIFRI